MWLDEVGKASQIRNLRLAESSSLLPLSRHAYTAENTARLKHGWSRWARNHFRRNLTGDFHVPFEPDPARFVSLPAVQNLPRRQAAGRGPGRAAAAQTEEARLHHGRVEALRWAAQSQNPHGCQWQSLRRDQGEQVLRAGLAPSFTKAFSLLFCRLVFRSAVCREQRDYISCRLEKSC